MRPKSALVGAGLLFLAIVAFFAAGLIWLSAPPAAPDGESEILSTTMTVEEVEPLIRGGFWDGEYGSMVDQTFDYLGTS